MPSCSYGARVANWLRAGYVNRAAGGRTTRSMAPEFRTVPLVAREPGDTAEGGGEHSNATRSADILLIDFSVNDYWQSGYQLALTPAVAKRLGMTPTSSLYEATAAATEALLRYALDEHPHTALLLVGTVCPPVGARAPSHAAYAAVARHYGVAYLSFPSALSGGREACAPGAAPKVYSHDHHPDWVGHQYVADAIVQVLQGWPCSRRPPPQLPPQPLGGHLAPRLPPPMTAQRGYEVCRVPTAAYRAVEAVARGGRLPGVTVRHGHWRAYEDVPGKAGWIATTANALIEFELRTGPFRPSVSVVWMQGYSGWGSAELRLTPKGSASGRAVHVHVLDGQQPGGLRVTQATALSMTVGPNSPWKLGTNVDFVLSLRLRCDGHGDGAGTRGCPKFKVLSVESC